MADERRPAYPSVERLLYGLGGQPGDARPAQPAPPRDGHARRAPGSRIPNEAAVSARADAYWAVRRLSPEDRAVILDTYVTGRRRHPYDARARAVRAVILELSRDA